jgi:transposase
MDQYTLDGYATREAFIATLKLSRSTFYRWISQVNIELPAGLLSVTDQQQIIASFEKRPRKSRKINTLTPTLNTQIH